MALSALALLGCGPGASSRSDGAAGATSGVAGTTGADALIPDGNPDQTVAETGPEAPAADADADGATLPDGSCVQGAYKLSGVCTCQDNTVSVCSAACVDLMSDFDNCGACGNACAPTAGCNAGVCGPPVTSVVPAAPGCVEIDLAVSASRLYWTDRGHGTVTSLAVAGGVPTTIAANEASPALVTLGTDDLFWVDVASMTPVGDGGLGTVSTTATIRAIKLVGGLARDLVTETNLTGGVRGLVASEDGQTLYYSAGTAIRAVPVAGGPAVDVGHEGEGEPPTALALHGNLIAFPVDLTGIIDVITLVPGQVATCAAPDPSSTPASQTVVDTNCLRASRGGAEPLQSGLVLRGDGVYWARNATVEVHRPPDGGTLAVEGTMAMSVFTGSASPIVTTSGDQVAALAGGPDEIYFASDDQISKAPYLENSTSFLLARGQKTPTSITVGATVVYWSSIDDCAINGVAR